MCVAGERAIAATRVRIPHAYAGVGRATRQAIAAPQALECEHHVRVALQSAHNLTRSCSYKILFTNNMHTLVVLSACFI